MVDFEEYTVAVVFSSLHAKTRHRSTVVFIGHLDNGYLMI